jgi:hypothetical protein
MPVNLSHEWRHGVFSTPLLTTASVYATGALIATSHDLGGTGLPWQGVGLVSLGGVLAASAARLSRTKSKPKAAFTAAWTGAAYSWITWTTYDTPWSLASAAALAAATVVLTPWYAVDRFTRRDSIAAQWAAEKAAEMGTKTPTEWEEAFALVGAKGITVVKTDATPGGCTVHLHHSATGAGARELAPHLERLERAMSLRRGALRLIEGEKASDSELRVTTTDFMAQTIPLPDDDHPIRISEPITVGMLESGEPIEILFRQNSILIAGMRGSGKSVALHVVLSLLTRCVDCVVWMIDMGGGNTLRRWLTPWLEGWTDRTGRLIDRPIIDWVATDADEAMRMINAAHEICDDRAMRMPGGKINPTPDKPAIYLITDENSDLMVAAPKSGALKTRVIKKGRKAAVDLLDAVQRGTGPNMGGGELKSQYDTRIGFKMGSRGETQYVFPDDYNNTNLAKLPARGAMYIKESYSTSAPARGRWMFLNDSDDVDDIEQASATRWAIRPDLDDDSVRVANRWGYADRWTDPNRIGWLTNDQAAPAPSKAAAPAPAPTTGLAPIRSVTAVIADAEQRRRAEEQSDLRDPLSPEGIRLTAEIDRFLTRQALPPKQPHPARDDAGREAVLDLVRSAEAAGTGVAAISMVLELRYDAEDRKPPSRKTITAWLNEHIEAGAIVRPEEGRYVATEFHTPEEQQ